MTTQPTLFISGAGGKLGRLVIEQLQTRGFKGRIIAGTRKPEELDIAGVEARKADFSDVAGFTAALEGVDRVLLISTDALGEARRAQHLNAVAAAKAAGVKRILYTSIPNADPGNAIAMAADHYPTEQAIKATGIDYTILRTSWYAENLFGSLPQALKSGKWFTSAGEGRISYLPRVDIARAAAGALISDLPGSRVLTVTGTEALTISEVAAIATEVTGKPIEVVNVSDADVTAGMVAAGLPQPVAELLTTFEVGYRQGMLSNVTNVVEEFGGAKPQKLRDFLAANTAALTA
jgi:NAD(P)H dehydrogenase (quinone)